MPSRKGSPNKKSQALDERWDALAKKIGIDPLEFVFQVLKAKPRRGYLTAKDCKTIDVEMRYKAAKDALSYRWPKLRTVEFGLGTDEREFIFRWMDETDPVEEVTDPAAGAE